MGPCMLKQLTCWKCSSGRNATWVTWPAVWWLKWNREAACISFWAVLSRCSGWGPGRSVSRMNMGAACRQEAPRLVVTDIGSSV